MRWAEIDLGCIPFTALQHCLLTFAVHNSAGLNMLSSSTSRHGTGLASAVEYHVRQIIMLVIAESKISILALQPD